MKKIWEKPNIEKLSVQKITLSGSSGGTENKRKTGNAYKLPHVKK